ncbi:MAG: MBL fold metallo-hydrolase [Deltaproteobacteria bacterium]|nr:MAG: MBL fold metallo-hydrolase [Deltaproteobacteria bacterium]
MTPPEPMTPHSAIIRLVLTVGLMLGAACAPASQSSHTTAPTQEANRTHAGELAPSGTGEASPTVAPAALAETATQRPARDTPGPDDVLRLFLADVGQGLGMFLISPEGRVVVYDAGTRGGGENIRSLMRQVGVERVDLAVMSHAHNDHLGGFIDIIEEFPTARFLDPGFPHTSNVYLRLLNRLEELEVPVFLAEAGRRVRIDRFTEAEIIFPSPPFLSGTRSDVNSNSIVLYIHFGDHTFLLTGDAEAATEQRLVAEGHLRPVDVLQVAHHGSNHSSTEAFLAAVRPRLALIGVGRGNSYGHPGTETLQRLEAAGVEAIYRTDIHGYVEVRSNGEILSAHPQQLP